MSLRTVRARLLDKSFDFVTHPGLFSAEAVDDGTLLLLENLPAHAPKSVLDVGCGWGALGLPVAANHPQASVTLVDRDLLAVAYARSNADRHGLGNVTCQGSLGYRDLPDVTYDWILCNVPARIGDAAIAYLLGMGAARLSPGGELRVVVIRDLADLVVRLAEERSWGLAQLARSDRHAVFALRRSLVVVEADHESLYRRDFVAVGGDRFERPHDINEELQHLREAVPLLLDCLPASVDSAATWRGGYGPVQAALSARANRVHAVDRDLLQLAFARRNVEHWGGVLDTYAVAAVGEHQAAVSLVVGELVPSAGVMTLTQELVTSQTWCEAHGQVLWVGPVKLMKELAPVWQPLRGVQLASRGSWAVMRLPARPAERP